MRLRVSGLVLLSVLAAAAPARADGPLGPDGSPITTSRYTLDLYGGPVLTTTRVTGMAGAFTALATGVEGGLENPAAVAARPPESVDWWDYWLAFGVTYPFDKGDFYDSGGAIAAGDGTDTSFYFVTPGAYLQLHAFGMGAALEARVADLARQDSRTGKKGTLSVLFLLTHLQVGWSFREGEIVVGGGLRIARQATTAAGDYFSRQGLLYRRVGIGGEAGVLYRPRGRRWRLGAAIFTPVGGAIRKEKGALTPAGDLVVDGLYLPRGMDLPWQGSVGAAVQLGPRPFNMPHVTVQQHAAEDLAAIDRLEEQRLDGYDAEIAEARLLHEDERAHALEGERAEWKDILDAERDRIEEKAWGELRNRVRNGWSRRYYLISVELVFTGRVENAVGPESFLAQSVQRAGEHVGVSPRLGFETEVWPHRLQLRAGTYVEPSRYAGVSARGHFTLGFTLKLFRWSVFGIWPEDYEWALVGAMDITRDYRAVSFALGGWY